MVGWNDRWSAMNRCKEMVEFDIVALRSDQDARVEWLANSISKATRESLSPSAETAQALGRTPTWRPEKLQSKPQRRHPLYRAGSSRLQQPGRKGVFDTDDTSAASTSQGDHASATSASEDPQPGGVDAPVFDIVALREDSNASVEWLDMGLPSSDKWEFLKDKLSTTP